MKASMTAAMVIGYRIPEEMAFQDRTVRGCHHEEVEGANFCPECGKLMWDTARQRILNDEDKFGEFEAVVVPTGHEGRYRYYLGHACNTYWTINELARYDFNKHRDELMKTLKDLGIDPTGLKFGVHLAAGVSC
jgi:hypothetical protein